MAILIFYSEQRTWSVVCDLANAVSDMYSAEARQSDTKDIGSILCCGYAFSLWRFNWNLHERVCSRWSLPIVVFHKTFIICVLFSNIRLIVGG